MTHIVLAMQCWHWATMHLILELSKQPTYKWLHAWTTKSTHTVTQSDTEWHTSRNPSKLCLISTAAEGPWCRNVLHQVVIDLTTNLNKLNTRYIVCNIIGYPKIINTVQGKSLWQPFFSHHTLQLFNGWRTPLTIATLMNVKAYVAKRFPLIEPILLNIVR